MTSEAGVNTPTVHWLPIGPQWNFVVITSNDEYILIGRVVVARPSTMLIRFTRSNGESTCATDPAAANLQLWGKQSLGEGNVTVGGIENLVYILRLRNCNSRNDQERDDCEDAGESSFVIHS